MKRIVFFVLASIWGLANAQTQDREVVTVASTTSTANSGLMEHVLPLAEAALGIDIRLVAVGTGRALKLQELGDVDAILVHDTAGELAALGQGFAQSRRPIMQNQFVILGPKDDDTLAGIRSGVEAFERLSALGETVFVSRGDDSGTHRAELRLWQQTDQGEPPSRARWYKETGQGMGATLRVAVGLQAHVLTDTGTWGSHGLNDQLEIKVMDDPAMANPYGYLVTSASRHEHINARAAERLGDWLRSQAGQDAIYSFSNNQMALFQPIF